MTDDTLTPLSDGLRGHKFRHTLWLPPHWTDALRVKFEADPNQPGTFDEFVADWIDRAIAKGIADLRDHLENTAAR